jgi:hypothetical protein
MLVGAFVSKRLSPIAVSGGDAILKVLSVKGMGDFCSQIFIGVT